jgi:Skp family chaperone for outer membrane proteins
MSDFMDTLLRDIDSLRALRDELKLQLHLGKAEAKDRWDKLETKWNQLEARSAEARRESLQTIQTATRQLVNELKEEYNELKSSL